MHIGSTVKAVILEKQMTVKSFAELLPCSRENAHRIFRREDMDTGLLRKISSVLNHDFFLDISTSCRFGHCDDNGHTQKSDK